MHGEAPESDLPFFCSDSRKKQRTMLSSYRAEQLAVGGEFAQGTKGDQVQVPSWATTGHTRGRLLRMVLGRVGALRPTG